MTLPLIYTLNQCDKQTKSKIIDIFKHANKKKDEIKYIIDTVIQHNGIVYAQQKMDLYIEESFVILNQFPDSDAKKHLVQLVQYSINRKY